MPAPRIVLANVDRPPDTASLVPCTDAETAGAIECVRETLLARRKSASARPDDGLTARLRRLRNPLLSGYRYGSCVLLSEPFNAIPSAIMRSSEQVARAAARSLFGPGPPASLVCALSAFGDAALRAAIAGGVRIAIVPEARRYAEFSPLVAGRVPGIDDWSAPPAGLFVVEERTILLRNHTMGMTAAHEFAHALDAVMAKRPRSYYSYESEELRGYFATASGFVNEYAASGLDEFFAESMRAYLEVNDARCAWLPLTRQDLFLRDPRMFKLVERLFSNGFEV